jgi:hypothetical protein
MPASSGAWQRSRPSPTQSPTSSPASTPSSPTPTPTPAEKAAGDTVSGIILAAAALLTSIAGLIGVFLNRRKQEKMESGLGSRIVNTIRDREELRDQLLLALFDDRFIVMLKRQGGFITSEQFDNLREDLRLLDLKLTGLQILSLPPEESANETRKLFRLLGTSKK